MYLLGVNDKSRVLLSRSTYFFSFSNETCILCISFFHYSFFIYHRCFELYSFLPIHSILHSTRWVIYQLPHHFQDLNPVQGTWESCQWLKIRRWISPHTPVSSNTYKWLVVIKPKYCRKVTINQDPPTDLPHMNRNIPNYIILRVGHAMLNLKYMLLASFTKEWLPHA